MITKIQSLKDILKETYNAFFCCASFENRCLTIPSEIYKLKNENSFIFFNPNYVPQIIDNKNKLLVILKENNPIEIELTSNSLDFIISIQSILVKLKLQKEIKILIDITTFTHEKLLILVNILKNKLDFTKDTVHLIYNLAKDYSTETNNMNDKWLSKGINDIRSILTFPGEMNPTKPYHLIILVGFEVERTLEFIDSFDANVVSLGLGKNNLQSGYINNIIEISSNKHSEIIKRYPFIDTFEFSISDPINTKNQILNNISKFPNTNTIISPMSSKVSTLSCALVSFECSSVQLCYASANHYNYLNFAEPSDDCIFIDLNKLL